MDIRENGPSVEEILAGDIDNYVHEKSKQKKIGVISDIHGNLESLNDAMNDEELKECDEIYCLGDIIGIGAYPNECADLLLADDRIRFIMGNHEAWLLNGVPDERADVMSPNKLAHYAWMQENVRPDIREAIAQFPYKIDTDFNGLKVTFTHYQWNGNDTADIVPPTAENLDKLFRNEKGDFIFIGHDHTPSKNGRYIGPGSLGCDRAGIGKFGVLTVSENGEYEYNTHEVAYDKERLAEETAELGALDFFR